MGQAFRVGVCPNSTDWSCHNMTRRGSWAVDPVFKRQVLPSIRSKTLMKLLLLTLAFMSEDSEMGEKVLQRERRRSKIDLIADPINLAWSLRPQDVIAVIHCSHRTAIDYIETLRLLSDWFEDGFILKARFLSYLDLQKRKKRMRCRVRRTRLSTCRQLCAVHISSVRSIGGAYSFTDFSNGRSS
jgi:hypothetical protein